MLADTWPRDYYAVDIVEGFEAIDVSVAGKQCTRAAAFKLHFGIKWEHGTYYEHHQRWNDASPEARSKALKAGQTVQGLWSTFMNATRAPHADVRAARKRTRVSRL